MKRFFLVLALLAFTSASRAQTITVSAAASLRDVLTDLGARYEKARPGAKVQFNFGASGALQKQIEAGAPVDLFISAADKNMDALVAQKLVDAKTRRLLTQNALVLIVPANSNKRIGSFRDLAHMDVSVAIGEPSSVPAGDYARQVLEKLGIWPQVAAKAVRAKDVRAVLTQVEQGNVDAGIVYRSDAATTNRVRIVATARGGQHSPINYPMAVVSDSKQKRAAFEFERFLLSKTARGVFKRAKFVVK